MSQRQMPNAVDRAEPSDRDVTVVEVGPRDGLQNEPGVVPTDVKIAFIEALAGAGLPVVEATSFVNPKRVPQLADAAAVMTGIRRAQGVRYPVLVPNERGLVRALAAGVDAIALFAAATEAFSTANVGASITETFDRFEPVVASAREHGMWVRGYVSVAFGCPYSGEVPGAVVANVSARLVALGCDEICLADTIGVGTPRATREVLETVLPVVSTERLALHFHDTSGNALGNIEEALAQGIRVFDAAAAGLGGCPFAPGAPGNLSTERLVERLASHGLSTGVSLEHVREAVALLAPYVPRLERPDA
jgi:isopropylmalate/homocitrate/citramalate synthase